MHVLIFFVDAGLLLGTMYARLLGFRFIPTDRVLDLAATAGVLGGLAFFGGQAAGAVAAARSWTAVVYIGFGILATMILVGVSSGTWDTLDALIEIWMPWTSALLIAVQVTFATMNLGLSAPNLKLPKRWWRWVGALGVSGCLLFLVRGMLFVWAPWFKAAYVVELAFTAVAPMLAAGVEALNSKLSLAILTTLSVVVTLLL